MKKILLVVFGIALLGVTAYGAKAQTGWPKDLSGWAWSSNIGWISFNSTDNGAGGGPYKVVMNSDGTLDGHAWSPHVGWIKFGGLSGFPTGGGTTASNADENSGQIVGWARSLQNADSAANSNGWISMSGTTHGVTYNSITGVFGGYAWGGEPIGWINFSPTVDTFVCAGCGQENRRPVAYNQSVSIPKGTQQSMTLGGTDPDGDPITYSVVSEPSSDETFSCNSAGTCTYKSVSTYEGPDSFTFRTYDGELYSENATVSITVTGQTSNELKLRIGSNAAAAQGSLTGTGGTSYLIKSGEPFGLAWTIPTGAGTCSPIVKLPNGSDSPTLFDNFTVSAVAASDMKLIEDTAISNGRYTLSISCDVGGNTNNVFLEVSRSSEEPT